MLGFIQGLLLIIIEVSIYFLFDRIGERVLCLQQYINVLFWLLIFVLVFGQVRFWKIGLFHYRRRRCYLLYCQKVSCFV